MSYQLQKEEKVDLDQRINKIEKKKFEIEINWQIVDDFNLGEIILYGWLELDGQKLCGNVRICYTDKNFYITRNQMQEAMTNQFLKIVGEIFHKKAESISFNFNNPLDNTLTILELEKEIRELREDRDNWKKSSDDWQNKFKDISLFLQNTINTLK